MNEFDSDATERIDVGTSSGGTITDGGVLICEATGGSGIFEGDDADPWTGPYTEYDRYGEPTGERYYVCRDCGREVLSGIIKSNVSHRDGCRFGAED